MPRPVSQLARLALAVGIIGLGAARYQIPAHAGNVSRVVSAAVPVEATSVLIWQGKVLPIVTDVLRSEDALITAVNNRDIDGIAKASDEFAGEQARFEAIAPTPSKAQPSSRVMDRGLRALSNGTKAIVVGFRASDSAGAQKASVQVEQGIKQFQQAIDQIRLLAGPVTTPKNAANASPQPTPPIQGLP